MTAIECDSCGAPIKIEDGIMTDQEVICISCWKKSQGITETNPQGGGP